jgi:hypothetical protein
LKHFVLTLGESRFALGLDPACAELLAAFYPTAKVGSEFSSEKGGNRLQVRRSGPSFEIDTYESWSDSPASQALTNPAVRRRLDDPALAMLALEEEIERLVIAQAEKLFALHGGAISTPAGTYLLLGNSGSGKSSTTFQLAELGHPCLCEEITLCNPSSWRVVPYPQTLALSEDLITEFTADFPLRGRLHRLAPAIVRYRPHPSPSAEDSARPIEHILLPEFRVGTKTRFDSVTAEEALPEVLGYSFPPNVETETQFDRMIELLERVEITRFLYSSAGAARAALSDLMKANRRGRA